MKATNQAARLPEGYELQRRSRNDWRGPSNEWVVRRLADKEPISSGQKAAQVVDEALLSIGLAAIRPKP